MGKQVKPDWDAIAAETAQVTRERHEEAQRVAAAESGMLDAASEWTKAWRIIAQALKEMRCPDCDGNARAIIARLAAQNMLIVRIDKVKE